MVSKHPRLRRPVAALASVGLAFGGVLLVAQPAQALTYTVDSLTDDGTGGTTLREAVEQANANPGADTINISVAGPIALSSPLVITGAVAIVGQGSSETTITRSADLLMFDIEIADPASVADRALSFTGLTLDGTNGAFEGGGISVDADPALGSFGLDDVVVTGFDGPTNATFAVSLINVGEVTIDDSRFLDNDIVGAGGGAIYVQSAPTVSISGSLFEGNTSEFGGGALSAFNVDDLSVLDSTFNANVTFESRGGAIAMSRTVGESTSLTIERSSFVDNGAAIAGGAIGAIDPIILSITDSAFASNAAPEGGAVYVGALFGDDTIDIIGSTFTDNTASVGDGGAVAIVSVAASARTTIERSSFLANITEGDGAVWIGVHGGYFSLDESTFAGNLTDSDNSGLQFDDASLSNPIVILQSTFDETGTAIGFGSLGAVFQLRHSTVLGETGLYTGAMTSDSAFISHSIVVGSGEFDVLNANDGPVDALWSIFGHPHNANMTTDIEGNQYDTDPLLEPLAANGGLALTRLPSATSPALDAGDPEINGLPDFDQRGEGFPRLVNGRVDIGAVERPAAVPAGPSLPATGADISPMVPIGAGLLLLAGATLVLFVRRVRTS